MYNIPNGKQLNDQELNGLGQIQTRMAEYLNSGVEIPISNEKDRYALSLVYDLLNSNRNKQLVSDDEYTAIGMVYTLFTRLGQQSNMGRVPHNVSGMQSTGFGLSQMNTGMRATDSLHNEFSIPDTKPIMNTSTPSVPSMMNRQESVKETVTYPEEGSEFPPMYDSRLKTLKKEINGNKHRYILKEGE